MAPFELIDRPIKLRHESDDEDFGNESGDEATGSGFSNDREGTSSEVESNGSLPTKDGTSDLSDPKDDEKTTEFRDISFGALAKAQDSFAASLKSRKRKASVLTGESQPEPSYVPDPSLRKERDSRPDQPLHRTSKHAPTMLSSKHPVSRKRLHIFEPSPALKSRDPRFDPTITSSTLNQQSSETINKNYAFLTNYQATEILNLKSQIKKSKDPAVTADLKAQIMSMESKIRNAQNQQKEREILRKHKQAEKEAIREGKKSKPYFLKKSDVKSRMEKERLEGMSKKAKELMEKRKLKRIKGKEKRDMPSTMVRRGFDG